MRAIVGAGSVALLSGGAAQALTANGFEYDHNLSFDGVDAGVFTSAQTFELDGPAAGWTATISGSFSDDAYPDAADLPIEVFTTNQTGAPYENTRFPNASGLYFRNLPDTFRGDNLTVSFDFTFENVSSDLESLDMAIYAAESVDNEIDTLTNANPFPFVTSENLTSTAGRGTNMVTFADSNGVDGRNGQWTTTTNIGDGDTVAWTYDYTLGTGEGKNMLGFNIGRPETPVGAVPIPAALPLLATAFGGLALATRGRRR